jgi:hypothetical protein
VHHGEDDLALLREQARADRLLEQRVYPVGERSELALVESTKDAAGVDDGGVGKRRLQVEEDTAGNQASMDSLQGVDDALKGQSSQRVREETGVEARRRLVEFESATDLEADTLGRFHWQHVPGFGDRVGARIDRKDRACSRSIAESEPAVAATDLENTRAVETPQLPKSRHLGLWIDHVGLESH